MREYFLDNTGFLSLLAAAVAGLAETRFFQVQAAQSRRLARRDVGVCMALVLLIGWTAANQGKPAPERGVAIPAMQGSNGL